MHPVAGLVLKLGRAEHHLETLRGEVEGFIQSDFYETVTDRDYKRRLVARVKNVEQPPPELSVLIGDCVHNLRSSLDHLAYALASYTQPLPELYAKTSAFPIFKTGPLYRRKGPAGALYKMRGMSRRTRAAIQRVQPYHRRKNPLLWQLWMLEELSSIDKHRLLHLTSASIGGTSFQLSGTGMYRLEGIEVLFRPLEENAVVGRFYGEFGPPATVQVKSNIVPDILFDKASDSRSVRGWPVLETLHRIRDAIVFVVLPELEPEMTRLFPREGGMVVAVGEAKPDHRRPDQRGFA